MTEAETILESIPGVKVFRPKTDDILAEYEKLVDETKALKTLKEVEQAYIVQVLQLLDGNKTATAKILGISLKGLYNKLHSYGFNFKKETVK